MGQGLRENCGVMLEWHWANSFAAPLAAKQVWTGTGQAGIRK